MRRRLVGSTLAVVGIVLALFGIPLAIGAQYALEQRAAESLRAEANRIAAAADFWDSTGITVTEAKIAQVASDNRFVQVRKPVSGTRPNLGADDDTGITEVGSRPPASYSLTGEKISQRGFVVVVQQSREALASDIVQMRLLIGAAAVFAMAVATGLTLLTANRLAEPMVDLAEMAERIGVGDPPAHRSYGVEELDRIASVLEATAARISRMLAAERHFAADASHQLRTPLTALSMRLEEIIETNDLDVVKEEASTALVQVERLTDVVQRVLKRPGRNGAAGSESRMSVDHVVRQQVREWRLAFESQGRAILVEGERGLTGLASPAGIGQVLATLLENSLVHGAGTVVVTTTRNGSWVAIKVEDGGEGISGELGNRVFDRSVTGGSGTGLGLAVARELAEADGGRLELIQHRPPIFSIFLTAAEELSPQR
ncbi:MAG TPA: HAMP domain-containing sensor histidine kinase [Actinomycetes bacterium]|nr:HAMP domain-containing sensor histidine kinase [Actinomycetes bacterium]